MHIKDEKELHKLGAEIDPANPNRAIPIQKPNPKDNPNVPPEARNADLTTPHKGGGFPGLGKVEDELPPPPNRRWGVAKLGKYAHQRHEDATQMMRRTAIHVYREGEALHLAKKKLKKEKGYGGWGGFPEEHGISTSSDARA